MRSVVGAARVAALLVIASIAVGCSNDGDDELSIDEYCEQIVAVQTIDDQLGQVETLELDDTYAELEALTARAPADIRPSLEILTEYTGQVVTAMDEVEPGDTEGANEALTTVTTEGLSAVETAGRDVEAYTSQHCRFDLRTGGTLPPPTTAPPTTGPPDSTAPPGTAG